MHYGGPFSSVFTEQCLCEIGYNSDTCSEIVRKEPGKLLRVLSFYNSSTDEPFTKQQCFRLVQIEDDQKKNVTQKLKFLLELVENIVGKGENAGNQHFLRFPQCF